MQFDAVTVHQQSRDRGRLPQDRVGLAVPHAAGEQRRRPQRATGDPRVAQQRVLGAQRTELHCQVARLVRQALQQLDPRQVCRLEDGGLLIPRRIAPAPTFVPQERRGLIAVRGDRA